MIRFLILSALSCMILSSCKSKQPIILDRVEHTELSFLDSFRLTITPFLLDLPTTMSPMSVTAPQNRNKKPHEVLNDEHQHLVGYQINSVRHTFGTKHKTEHNDVMPEPPSFYDIVWIRFTFVSLIIIVLGYCLYLLGKRFQDNA
ncbi:MAG: hypothetical protein IIU96_02960 [Paludibacteraceae bacterium]|nr:hypothetical protein [Paludibacteraceae bacterium]